jgi:hypothetical protein
MYGRFHVARIVQRYVDRIGMEFPTEEALKTYLEEHPGADRSNHSVKPTEPSGPVKLKEDPWAYFNKVPEAVMVPIDKLETIRARPTGIQNAEKYMADAASGKGKKRKPISVKKDGKGGWIVMDGNSTTAIARKHGWKNLPAVEVQ